MSRWVLLRHTLPDGTSHYDWLIEAADASHHDSHGSHDSHDSPDSRSLLCFRLEERPDDPRVHQFAAERLIPHRRMYLDYEGPVAGDRGRVSRVAWGTCVVLCDDAAEFRVQLSEPPARQWVGRSRAASRYDFRAV